MTTRVMTRERFIKTIEKNIKPTDIVIVTDDAYGEWYAATKRVSALRVGFAFHRDAFARPEDLNSIMGDKVGIGLAILTCKESNLSTKAKDLLKKIRAAPVDTRTIDDLIVDIAHSSK